MSKNFLLSNQIIAGSMHSAQKQYVVVLLVSTSLQRSHFFLHSLKQQLFITSLIIHWLSAQTRSGCWGDPGPSLSLLTHKIVSIPFRLLDVAVVFCLGLSPLTRIVSSPFSLVLVPLCWMTMIDPISDSSSSDSKLPHDMRCCGFLRSRSCCCMMSSS